MPDIPNLRTFESTSRSRHTEAIMNTEPTHIETVDTIVIGGGQTGLTIGYHLAQAKRDFVILDAGSRVGDAWRSRWESLLLFTPARLNGLPGLPFPAPRDEFITKDEMADYLEEYARCMDLPVRLDMRVERVSRRGDGFEVYAGGQLHRSSNVVVATSSYGNPKVPAFATELDPSVIQLHSAVYRTPSQLPDGPVLIVGVGNSGADITMELAKTREVIVAGETDAVIPFRIEPWFARNVLVSGVFVLMQHVVTLRTPVGRKALAEGGKTPLIRVKPKDIAAVARRVPRVVSVTDGKPVTEAGEALDVAGVLWCTGFRPSFPWLDLPVLGDGGEPQHDRGIVESEPGLYFCGLHFQFAAASDSIVGMQRDAKYVMRHLLRNRTLRERGGATAPSAAPR
jgi:putative flavoprotein involved in K+ transport